MSTNQSAQDGCACTSSCVLFLETVKSPRHPGKQDDRHFPILLINTN